MYLIIALVIAASLIFGFVVSYGMCVNQTNKKEHMAKPAKPTAPK